MKSKKNVLVSLWSVLLFCAAVSSAGAADPVSPLIVDYQAILQAHPLAKGEKGQAIRIAGDETATVSLVRFAPGAEVKPHIHKTHAETVYVLEGTGCVIIDGKEIDIKPGSINFNPMNKVHAIKNTGSGEMIGLQIFTPAMTEPDRIFVP